MARLDRLVSAKGIAQLAAVLGRQFAYALLHAVSQLDAMTLQRELGRLVEVEIVYQRGVPPQATYVFKHALIQDAAYESLLKSTRQHYHQRIAQVLEEQFSETAEVQPELLAHHYTEAGLLEQSVAYWYKAGQRAVERSAHREAMSHLHKGLEVLTALPDTPTGPDKNCGSPSPSVSHSWLRTATLPELAHYLPSYPGTVSAHRRSRAALRCPEWTAVVAI